nr:nuclease [Candidatus Saccharibacteria bacterium]NIV04488.1 nuclease [Calditrichia bacterium]NIV73085.1 nuclease [Calditrichia bacterium]NIW00372.1 nuclease [Candidatus Saccharibacteria bacterium]NIW80726.1 nuclease [Calditrichia bacterium]
MARKEIVTKVIDGDTFKTNKRKRPVRLNGVDAPEKGEKGSKKATGFLEKLIQDEEVSVQTVARDPY